MSRPIQARIDLAALRHNYLLARRQAAPARIWAVAKANAYGHGIEEISKKLVDLGIRPFRRL